MAELDVIAGHELFGRLLHAECLVKTGNGHLDQELEEVCLLPECTVEMHQQLRYLQGPQFVQTFQLLSQRGDEHL